MRYQSLATNISVIKDIITVKQDQLPLGGLFPSDAGHEVSPTETYTPGRNMLDPDASRSTTPDQPDLLAVFTDTHDRRARLQDGIRQSRQVINCAATGKQTSSQEDD
jgi:hypothetical protein